MCLHGAPSLQPSLQPPAPRPMQGGQPAARLLGRLLGRPHLPHTNGDPCLVHRTQDSRSGCSHKRNKRKTWGQDAASRGAVMSSVHAQECVSHVITSMVQVAGGGRPWDWYGTGMGLVWDWYGTGMGLGGNRGGRGTVALQPLPEHLYVEGSRVVCAKARHSGLHEARRAA